MMQNVKLLMIGGKKIKKSGRQLEIFGLKFLKKKKTYP